LEISDCLPSWFSIFQDFSFSKFIIPQSKIRNPQFIFRGLHLIPQSKIRNPQFIFRGLHLIPQSKIPA
jgi:hypothetical protein